MELDFVIRLAVAGLLGALIGLEREFRAKEARFEDAFLVAVGSALMMIVSKYGFLICYPTAIRPLIRAGWRRRSSAASDF